MEPVNKSGRWRAHAKRSFCKSLDHLPCVSVLVGLRPPHPFVENLGDGARWPGFVMWACQDDFVDYQFWDKAVAILSAQAQKG